MSFSTRVICFAYRSTCSMMSPGYCPEVMASSSSNDDDDDDDIMVMMI